MALKAAIHKLQLQVADMDRHHYAEHALTVARHPSETDERMMVRVLAFALNADEAMMFGRGVSTADEPDLWQHSLNGEIAHWIQLGQPDVRDLRRACGRARQVTVITYSGHSAALWWEQVADKCTALANLTVVDIPVEAVKALATLAARNMALNALVQEGSVWLSDAATTVTVAPLVRHSPH